MITEEPALPTTIEPAETVATEVVAELYVQVPPVGFAEGLVGEKDESPKVLVTSCKLPITGSAFATVTVAAVKVAAGDTTPVPESVSVIAHV